MSNLGDLVIYLFLNSNDSYGNLYLNDIKKSGINTADKKYFFGDGMTGSCLVLSTPDAERTMNTCLGASSNFYSIKNIKFDDLKLSRYLYIEGYLVTLDIAIEAIKKSISFSIENDVKINLTFSDLSMVKYFREKLN